jgi:hypothetical protein
MIRNASWYVTNQTLHDDLKVPFIKDVIPKKKYKPSRQTRKPQYSHIATPTGTTAKKKGKETLASRPN